MQATSTILRRLCFVDIETTGLDPSTDQIVELGAVFVEHGAVVRRQRWLVRPTLPIPALITALTGLTDEEVSGAPPLDAVEVEVREALGGWTLVAHNAGFERSFLGERIAANAMLDSCEVAQLLFPERSSHSLDALVRWLGVGRGARHRALDDAEDTFLMLAALTDRALQQVDRERLERLLFQLEGSASADRAALCELLRAIREAPPVETDESPPPPAPLTADAQRLVSQLASWLHAPAAVSAELEREGLLSLALEAGRLASRATDDAVAIAVPAGTFRELSDSIDVPALARRAVCSTALRQALHERGADEAEQFARAYLSSWLDRTRTGDVEAISGFVRSRFASVAPLLEAATTCRCEDPGCLSRAALGERLCVVITHEHALEWLERGAPVSMLFVEADRLPDAERRRTQRSLEVWRLERLGGFETILPELVAALTRFPAGVISMRARATPEWHAVREALGAVGHELRQRPATDERNQLLTRLAEVLEPPPPDFEVQVSPNGLFRVPMRPNERVARRLRGGHCLVSSYQGGLAWLRGTPVSAPTDRPMAQLEWLAAPTPLERLVELVARAAPVVLVTPGPLAPVAEACVAAGLTVSLDAERPSAVQLCEWRRDRALPSGPTCVLYGVREWRRAVLSSQAPRVMLVSPTGLEAKSLERALRGLQPRPLTS